MPLTKRLKPASDLRANLQVISLTTPLAEVIATRLILNVPKYDQQAAYRVIVQSSRTSAFKVLGGQRSNVADLGQRGGYRCDLRVQRTLVGMACDLLHDWERPCRCLIGRAFT